MRAVNPRRPTTPRPAQEATPQIQEPLGVAVREATPGSDHLCVRVGDPYSRLAPARMHQIFKWLGSGLADQPSWRYLDLSHQRLDSKMCKGLGQLLSENPQLKGLKVRYCVMGAEGLAHILDGIQGHAGFALCFGGAEFKIDEVVCEALTTCQATHIDLSTVRGSNAQARRIVKALTGNPWVRSLDLSHFALGNDVEPLLMKGQLTHLHLRSVRPANGYEMTDLLRALACCSSMKVLDLSQVALSGESETKALKSIVRHPNMRVLSLSNLLRPREGLEAALKVFAAGNTRIRKLDLSNNFKWSCEEFDLLVLTLQTNRQLHELSLSNCGLTDEHSVKLRDALRQHCFLRSIDLRKNDLGQELVAKIREVVNENLHKLARDGLKSVLGWGQRNIPDELLSVIVGFAGHANAPTRDGTLAALIALPYP